jgi:hypothetical protein
MEHVGHYSTHRIKHYKLSCLNYRRSLYIPTIWNSENHPNIILSLVSKHCAMETPFRTPFKEENTGEVVLTFAEYKILYSQSVNIKDVGLRVKDWHYYECFR